MIALVVSLKVHENHLDDFLAAIEQNAERSFNDEPGCSYFDVTQGVDDPLHFVFYELYEEDTALEAHRAAPHFAKWREAVDKYVVTGSQVNTTTNQLFHHA